MDSKLQIKSELLPVRCEICHQSDLFNPKTGQCERCNSSISIPRKLEKQKTGEYYAKMATTVLVLIIFIFAGISLKFYIFSLIMVAVMIVAILIIHALHFDFTKDCELLESGIMTDAKIHNFIPGDPSKIVFHYQFEGKEYSSETEAWRKFSINQPIRIFIDPKNPESFVIEETARFRVVK